MHTEQFENGEILGQLARGDRHATEQIYKLHSRAVFHWIIQHGGDSTDAADVFQEAMVVLFEKAQQEDFRLSCKLGTYLFAVSKNLWRQKLRETGRQNYALPDQDELDDGFDHAYEDDLKAHVEREAYFEQLQSSMDLLGEPCRSLLKAFYMDDKSMNEIAADFGYTNSDNAKTQKYKCLNRLKKLFFGATAKTDLK